MSTELGYFPTISLSTGQKNKLINYLSFSGILWFSIPIINNTFNKIFGTRYNHRDLTGSYVMGVAVDKRWDKIIKMSYNYLFSSDILDVLYVNTFLSNIDALSTNPCLMKATQSLINNLVSDITMKSIDLSDSLTMKLFNSFAIFWLVLINEKLMRIIKPYINFIEPVVDEPVVEEPVVEE